MSAGTSKITGPFPPYPTQLLHCNKCPTSACGKLEGSSPKLDFLMGPMTPDPTLYPSFYSTDPAKPPPRIHQNAYDILEKGQRGTVGLLLQLEGISHYKTAISKSKIKDHQKDNIQKMREIQKKSKEKEMDKKEGVPIPVKALWKSKKYVNVESKFKQKIQEAHSFQEAQAWKSTSPRTSTNVDREENKIKERKVKGPTINFVEQNARSAKRMQLRQSRSLQNLTDVLEQKKQAQEEYNSKQKGHIPQYLLNRKEIWLREREDQKIKILDPSLPPGHAIMPEVERQKTLNNLKQKHEQLIKELLNLPFRLDSLSTQNRNKELQSKLSEVEEAIKIFSFPKVFIKIDS